MNFHIRSSPAFCQTPNRFAISIPSELASNPLPSRVALSRAI
jgi:hypothetical protein